MKFEVTILGSGAAVPTSKRRPTAQYVTCKNKHILIDCGEGTQLQFRKFGIKLQRLQYILISHLHGDHYFGLVGLISTMHLLGRDKNLTIAGPVGLKEIIKSQLEAGGAQLDFDINYIELTGKEKMTIIEDDVFKIDTFPLKHKIPTNGFIIREKENERNLNKKALADPEIKVEYYHKLKKGLDITLENGTILLADDYTLKPKPTRSYAYCSDTAYYPSIIESIKGATLLYHEATFLTNQKGRAKKTMHSTAGQSAKIALDAEVGRLLMGHLSARYSDGHLHEEEARTVFPNSTYVNDGESFLVK